MAGLRLAFTDSIPDHLRALHGSSGKKESRNGNKTFETKKAMKQPNLDNEPLGPTVPKQKASGTTHF